MELPKFVIFLDEKKSVWYTLDTSKRVYFFVPFFGFSPKSKKITSVAERRFKIMRWRLNALDVHVPFMREAKIFRIQEVPNNES